MLIIIIFIQNRHIRIHIHRYLKNVIENLCYYYETLATEDYLINTKEAYRQYVWSCQINKINQVREQQNSYLIPKTSDFHWKRSEREVFHLLLLTNFHMFHVINCVFCLLSFTQKHHRKYLNEHDHSQISNLGGKVGNLFGSFSAELGNVIKKEFTERYFGP